MDNGDKFLDPVDLTRLVVSTYPIYWNWYIVVGVLAGVLYGCMGLLGIKFGIFTERMILSGLAFIAWGFALLYLGQDELIAKGLVRKGDPKVVCFLGIGSLHARFVAICSITGFFAILVMLAEITLSWYIPIFLHFWVSILISAEVFMLLGWLQLRGLRKILKFIIGHPPGFSENTV